MRGDTPSRRTIVGTTQAAFTAESAARAINDHRATAGHAAASAFPRWKTRAAAVVASATWDLLKTALETEDSPWTSIGSKQPAKATIAAKAGGKRRAAARETGKDMVRVTPLPTRTSIRSAASATAAQRAICDHLPSRARRSEDTSRAS